MRATEKAQGILMVTADHGNADEMVELDKKGNLQRDKSGTFKAKTAHTLNPVPFAIYDPLFKGEYKLANLDKRGLSNIASTLLQLMGYEAPEDYDPALITFE
jgi:2,3-bisphosphoglycerate-independent phosphoglycerate mutase